MVLLLNKLLPWLAINGNRCNYQASKPYEIMGLKPSVAFKQILGQATRTYVPRLKSKGPIRLYTTPTLCTLCTRDTAARDDNGATLPDADSLSKKVLALQRLVL